MRNVVDDDDGQIKWEWTENEKQTKKYPLNSLKKINVLRNTHSKTKLLINNDERNRIVLVLDHFLISFLFLLISSSNVLFKHTHTTIHFYSFTMLPESKAEFKFSLLFHIWKL